MHDHRRRRNGDPGEAASRRLTLEQQATALGVAVLDEYHRRKAAIKLVHRALKLGQLIKRPCEVCGKTDVEGHHEDYRKPLEVVWLCKRHHILADQTRRRRNMAGAV